MLRVLPIPYTRWEDKLKPVYDGNRSTVNSDGMLRYLGGRVLRLSLLSRCRSRAATQDRSGSESGLTACELAVAVQGRRKTCAQVPRHARAVLQMGPTESGCPNVTFTPNRCPNTANTWFVFCASKSYPPHNFDGAVSSTLSRNVSAVSRDSRPCKTITKLVGSGGRGRSAYKGHL